MNNTGYPLGVSATTPLKSVRSPPVPLWGHAAFPWRRACPPPHHALYFPGWVLSLEAPKTWLHNVAARVLCRVLRRGHIGYVLKSLHSLTVTFRIKFKIWVMSSHWRCRGWNTNPWGQTLTLTLSSKNAHDLDIFDNKQVCVPYPSYGCPDTPKLIQP